MNESLHQEVVKAISIHLRYARSSLQSQTDLIEDMIRSLTDHLQERDKLQNRVRVLEAFLIDNGVDVKETK